MLCRTLDWKTGEKYVTRPPYVSHTRLGTLLGRASGLYGLKRQCSFGILSDPAADPACMSCRHKLSEITEIR